MTAPTDPHPQKGDRRDSRLPSPIRNNAVWWVLGLLAILAVAQVAVFMPAGRAVTYSEFKAFIRAGQVDEVVIGADAIVAPVCCASTRAKSTMRRSG